MSSIGFDLAKWRCAGLLRFLPSRPTSGGLETHLATILAVADEFQPSLIVVDPISAFSTATNDERVKLMLIRMQRNAGKLGRARKNDPHAAYSRSGALTNSMPCWVRCTTWRLSRYTQKNMPLPSFQR